MQKLFSENISVYAIFNDQSFNDTLTNDIVSFEQLVPIFRRDAIIYYFLNEMTYCQPRWLSWMCRPTGDQEVAGSTPAEVCNILSWRLIMKHFLRSFSPYH